MKLIIPQDTLDIIYGILKKGNTAELKLVGGQVQVIEIRRKIKYRLTPPTGEADG